jgi:hypothetical protein
MGNSAVPDLEALGLQVVIEGVGNVLRGELAVALLPLHAFADLDAPGERIGIAPLERHAGHDRAFLEVDVHQPVEDVVHHQAALDVGADDRAEIAELAAPHADAQLALALRDRRRPAGPEQKASSQRSGTQAAARNTLTACRPDDLAHRCLHSFRTLDRIPSVRSR